MLGEVLSINTFCARNDICYPKTENQINAERFMKIDINLFLAWLWILLGFLTGMAMGFFFHNENWLGGYADLKRRMYRLAHISFFGLGAVNLLFWLTMQQASPEKPLAGIASCAFIVGAVTMPICCVVMAHFPKAHLSFAIPVLSLIAGGVLTLLEVAKL